MMFDGHMNSAVSRDYDDILITLLQNNADHTILSNGQSASQISNDVGSGNLESLIKKYSAVQRQQRQQVTLMVRGDMVRGESIFARVPVTIPAKNADVISAIHAKLEECGFKIATDVEFRQDKKEMIPTEDFDLSKGTNISIE